MEYKTISYDQKGIDVADSPVIKDSSTQRVLSLGVDALIRNLSSDNNDSRHTKILKKRGLYR